MLYKKLYVCGLVVVIEEKCGFAKDIYYVVRWQLFCEERES